MKKLVLLLSFFISSIGANKLDDCIAAIKTCDLETLKEIYVEDPHYIDPGKVFGVRRKGKPQGSRKLLPFAKDWFSLPENKNMPNTEIIHFLQKWQEKWSWHKEFKKSQYKILFENQMISDQTAYFFVNSSDIVANKENNLNEAIFYADIRTIVSFFRDDNNQHPFSSSLLSYAKEMLQLSKKGYDDVQRTRCTRQSELYSQNYRLTALGNYVAQRQLMVDVLSALEEGLSLDSHEVINRLFPEELEEIQASLPSLQFAHKDALGAHAVIPQSKVEGTHDIPGHPATKKQRTLPSPVLELASTAEEASKQNINKMSIQNLLN